MDCADDWWNCFILGNQKNTHHINSIAFTCNTFLMFVIHHTIICCLPNIPRHFKLIVFWLANFMIDFNATRSLFWSHIYSSFIERALQHIVPSAELKSNDQNKSLASKIWCSKNVFVSPTYWTCFENPNRQFHIPFIASSFLPFFSHEATAAKCDPWHTIVAPFRCTSITSSTQQNCILIMFDPLINFRDNKQYSPNAQQCLIIMWFKQSRTLNIFVQLQHFTSSSTLFSHFIPFLH